jgi:selenide,water dikinase
METRDDAGYVPFGGGVLLQTADFFTPIVDDPYRFGQIAAANAFSDIYAMGGEPLTAMNLVCFPCSLDLAILRDILAGGQSKIEEAGARLCGGHSVQDEEPKYGLSVTGWVEVDKVVRNAGAQVGDALVITKPLGLGILTTALKRELVSEQVRWEINELNTPTALRRFGAPFKSEHGEVSPEDSELPILRYIFVHHIRDLLVDDLGETDLGD